MVQTGATAHTSTSQIVSGLPVAPEIIFTDKKNQQKSSTEKRQKKLLEMVSPFLKPFLLPDEKILLVTTACSPMSFLEQFFSGSIIYYLKRAFLIFTDRRILHIPTTNAFKYRQCIARILYSDCKKLSSSWSGGTFIVEYKGGKVEKFISVAGKERGKLKMLLSQFPLDSSAASNAKRVHLCPRCSKELESEKFICPQCRLEFKDKDSARRISIIYPGGGYFYLGHPWLGLADAITESFLIFVVVLGILGAMSGEKGGWGSVFTFSAFLFFEKVLSVYHSNHFVEEWIPKEKNVSFRANH